MKRKRAEVEPDSDEAEVSASLLPVTTEKGDDKLDNGSPSTPVSSSSVATLRQLPAHILLLSMPSLLLASAGSSTPSTATNTVDTTTQSTTRNSAFLTHTYAQALSLSILSVQRALSFPAVKQNPDLECRAWTSLAELGMLVVEGVYCTSADDTHDVWAKGTDNMIEKATSKGLQIAQKHPSLRLYRPHLTLISARLSAMQGNHKFARNMLKRLLSAMQEDASFPDSVLYRVWIGYIELLLDTPTSGVATSSSPTNSNVSVNQALASLTDISSHAQSKGHANVVTWAKVVRVRVLIREGIWEQVRDGIDEAERQLGLSVSDPNKAGDDASASTAQLPLSNLANLPPMNASPTKRQKISHPSNLPSAFSSVYASPHLFSPPTPFIAMMKIHLLLLATTFYTHLGSDTEAAKRLATLYILLDPAVPKPQLNESAEKDNVVISSSQQEWEGTLDWLVRIGLGDGVVQIPLSTLASGPPLVIRTTPASTLRNMAFLQSAAAKRDPVGRKPRRKLFAHEGLRSVEKELQKQTVNVSIATTTTSDSLPNPSCKLIVSPLETAEAELRLVKIKADLLSELIGVSILRSEFGVAERDLGTLISLTTSYSLSPRPLSLSSTSSPPTLFSSYAPRITLHHAHLAHARGNIERALDCYRVAQFVAMGSETTVPTSATTNGKGKCLANTSSASASSSPIPQSPLDSTITEGDQYVRVSAMAGEVLLRVGVLRVGQKQRMMARSSQVVLVGPAPMDVDGPRSTSTEIKEAKMQIDSILPVKKRRVKSEKQKGKAKAKEEDEEEDELLLTASQLLKAAMRPLAVGKEKKVKKGRGRNQKKTERGAHDMQVEDPKPAIRHVDISQESEGLLASQFHEPTADNLADEAELEAITALAQELIPLTRGMGGTMASVGKIVEAVCLNGGRIVGAKTPLKTALTLTTNSADNHLRALVVALISSHFFHTAPKHALDMLGTLEGLGSGMGAGERIELPPNEDVKQESQVIIAATEDGSPTKKRKLKKAKARDEIGNGPLRLWAGERSLEIHKRQGDLPSVAKQEQLNTMLHRAWERARERDARGSIALRSVITT